MKKNLKTVKATLLIGVLLFSIIISFASSVSAQDPEERNSKIIAFNSYLYVTFDKTNLAKPLNIDEVIDVPMKVTFKTGVPDGFILNLMPNTLKNWLIYGDAMSPQQKIELSVIDKPDWANINLVQPSLLIDFPEPGGEISVDTNLEISPYREAPAVPYSITIEAKCDPVGRIRGISLPFTLTFTPSYIPQVEIYVDEPVREVGPRETVNFNVRIENKANKHTIVQLEHMAPDDWAPSLNVKEIEIAPASSEEVTFSVIAPYSFGWHDNTVSMELKCTPYPSPKPSQYLDIYQNASVGADITITNYGFSVSGSEPIFIVIVIAVIVLIAVLYVYRKK